MLSILLSSLNGRAAETNQLRLFDLRVSLPRPSVPSARVPETNVTLNAKLHYSGQSEGPPSPVIIRMKPASPKGFSEAIRSLPRGIVKMFDLTEPVPPRAVIRPQDVPAAAQPLPKSMSAPYKSPPLISTGERGIWNSRD